MHIASRYVSIMFALSPLCAAAGNDVLSPQGYGTVRFGMRIEAAKRALKQDAKESYSTSGCDYVEFKKYPGLRFMIEDGVITRADARRGIPNSAGVPTGMSMKKVRAMHPSIKIEPHHYEDEGHYLLLDASDGSAALVFEEIKGKITHVRAGLKPAVQYVEGCS